MHFIYLLARTYPWWAVPVAIVFGQLFVYFWRKRSTIRFFFGGMMVLLVTGAMLWIYFRGDLNSDKWVRAIIE